MWLDFGDMGSTCTRVDNSHCQSVSYGCYCQLKAHATDDLQNGYSQECQYRAPMAMGYVYWILLLFVIIAIWRQQHVSA